jgi:hypothetical protein
MQLKNKLLKLPDKIPPKLLEFWDWGKMRLIRVVEQSSLPDRERKLDLKNKLSIIKTNY